MGTPGHMQHPFDISNVKTGQDLINYFEKIVDHLSTSPGSVKFDGTNVSFKLVDDESAPAGKDFRMDRGTTHAESVTGMTIKDAYKFWEEGHGMPPAIDELLTIFNEALPQIKPELKTLGMWDDPTRFFNTEYMKKGKTNVIEYDEKILAIHGINQFYEKKAPKKWVESGKSIDRPGLIRPDWHFQIDPETGKPFKKPGSIEVADYDKEALKRIIEKVKPIAEKYGISLVGDVPTETAADVSFTETLSAPWSVRTTETETQTRSLREWLSSATNPFAAKVTKKEIINEEESGRDIPAIGKEVYVAIEVDKTPLDQFLLYPERDAITAINGALFNHTTLALGMDIKRATTSSKGGLESHEGIVVRGLGVGPVKVTGDFILKGRGGEISKKIAAALSEGKVPRMVKKSILEQNEGEYDEVLPPKETKIGLVPMSAKPYHAGHHMLVQLAAISEITDELEGLELPVNDIVGVFVSFSGRGIRNIKDPSDSRTLSQGARKIEDPKPGETPIFGSDMEHIWQNILKPNLELPKKVKLVTPEDGASESPVRNIHDICTALKEAYDANQETFDVPHLGFTASVGGTIINIYSDDQDIVENYSDEVMEKYGELWKSDTTPAIHPVGVPRSRTIEVSGTEMREYLCKGDIERFSELLPPLPKDKKVELANILIKSIECGMPLKRRELQEVTQYNLGIFLGLIKEMATSAGTGAVMGAARVDNKEDIDEEEEKIFEEEEDETVTEFLDYLYQSLGEQ